MTVNLLDPSEVKDFLKRVSNTLDRYDRAAEWLEAAYPEVYEEWVEAYNK